MIRRTEWVAECMFAKENDPCSLQYTSQTNLVSIWMLQKLLAQKLRAPFCTAAIFCLVATKQASETSSWRQWGTASEGSPALWWWSWKLHHTLVWPISPDNSLWGTYRRMGQDPKKRVLNISVLGEYSIITSIIFCMVQVSLASQETPVTISRRNSQRFLPSISDSHGSEKDPSVWKVLPPQPKSFLWSSYIHVDSVNMLWRKFYLRQVSNNV